jgi:hypothetical protein
MPNDESNVFIEGNDLVIEKFRNADPEVVALMREADDLPAATHRALGVAARALRAVQVSIDSAVIERAFDEMREMFRRSLNDFAREITEKADGLLDAEEGDLPRTLVAFKGGVEALLGETFDPNNKKSAVSKLETVLSEAGEQQVAAVRRLIDPDNEDSPLGRYRTEIVRAVEKQAATIVGAFSDLKTQLAVEQARAEALEHAAGKGFTFEEMLERCIVQIAGGSEDVAERVGGTPGGNSRKGDFGVTLNPAETAGEGARYVLEAKDSPKKLREILNELDDAMENRDALAGIVVFATSSQSPVDAPFKPFDNKAIVVFEKASPNDLALRLACCWARWVVRRQLSKAGDEIDLARVSALIDNARRALATSSKIRTALGGSKTHIDRALGHVEVLVSDIEAALQSIEAELVA